MKSEIFPIVKRKILRVLLSWGSLQPSRGVQHLGGCGSEGDLYW